MRSALYTGTVWHTRRTPVPHRFDYPVWYLGADLDELPTLDRELRLFGHNRARPVSLHDADHLGDATGDLAARLRQRLAEHGLAPDGERTVLFTTPRLLGRTFNPISLWLHLDEEERIVGGAAEVNSTFGEGRLYPLRHPRDAGLDVCFTASKALHVSPFLEVEGEYRFRIRLHDDSYRLGIELHQNGEQIMAAGVVATRRELSDRALGALLVRYPLTTWRTLPRILRQAATLYLRRRLAFHPQPERVDDRTYLASRQPWLSEFRLPAPVERWLRLGTRQEQGRG